MSSIITFLKDLFTPIFEVTFSAFKGAIDMVSGLVTGLVSSVIGLVKMTLHTVSNLLEAAGGVGKFVASNIVVLGLITGGVYGYLQYQSRRGQTVKVGQKKRLN